MSETTRTLDAAILAYDSHAGSDSGWFVRGFYSDGEQEDDACEGTDESDAPLYELEAYVVARGGTWARPTYRDGDGGSFEWSAPDTDE